MKNIVVVFAVLVAVALAGVRPAAAQQWWPQWTEDFSGAAGPVSAGEWSFDLGNNNGWGNNEAETYTNALSNCAIDGSGHLVITALSNLTSARIESVPSWTYGTLEVGAQLPSGAGLWPAIWMMPVGSVYGGWPNSGEIDIMEQRGSSPTVVHFTSHSAATGGGGDSAQTTVPTAPTAFHDYRVDWAPDHIAGFVDGVQYFYQSRNGGTSTTWPFDQPFHLILNDAIGGTWGGTIDNSIFPQSFPIDYVHLWKMGSTPYAGTAPAIPTRVEAENYDLGGEGFGYHSASTVNQGGQYRQDGVGIGATTDENSYYVGWMTPDEWLNYSVQASHAGTYPLTFRLASPYSGGSFNVEVDDSRVATVTVPNTGGWDAWQNVVVSGVSLGAGFHRIRLLSNSANWNINYFDVGQAFTTVSGTVSLQGLSSGSLAQPLTFTLTPSGATTGAATTQALTPSADGSFTLADVPAGTYTLGVKGSTWLRHDVALDATGGDVTLPPFTLPGGDINGDNRVNAADFLVLNAAYGTRSGQAGYSAAADLNGDGRVNAADFLILNSNYGKKGDP